MTRRPAFTLVELLIALSASGTLMVLAIGAVHRTMILHSASQQQDAVHRAAARLSREFRRDVHRAATVEIADGVLHLMGGTPAGNSATTYSIADEVVTREQTSNDARRREEYRFGTDAQCEFSEQANPRRIVVTITRATPSTNAPPRTLLHVEAAIGTHVYK